MRKNEDREFSWAWRIFVPVVIVVMGLKLLLAGVFGNKPDRMGRGMKKSGKAPKRVRAFFSSKEHELSEEWFDGAELVAVLGEVNKRLCSYHLWCCIGCCGNLLLYASKQRSGR